MATRFLSVAIVIILILSAYLALEVTGLQGQVASLQDQNSGLQSQVVDLQSQQNYLQSQIIHLLSTSTQTSVFSFELQDICVSVTPLCYTYTGHQGSYVYAMTIVNNGTVLIPVTSSVYLEFTDVTRSTSFAFNASLSEEIPSGAGIYLNSTTWPASSNATLKIAPGDVIGLAVFVGSFRVIAEAHVATCSTSTTTIENYTSTLTQTVTSCAY